MKTESARAHAKRCHYCDCGKTARGNGGKYVHQQMHIRRGDGHRYINRDEFVRRFGEPGSVVEKN
jgi:hypothetical protein